MSAYFIRDFHDVRRYFNLKTKILYNTLDRQLYKDYLSKMYLEVALEGQGFKPKTIGNCIIADIKIVIRVN